MSQQSPATGSRRARTACPRCKGPVSAPRPVRWQLPTRTRDSKAGQERTVYVRWPDAHQEVRCAVLPKQPEKQGYCADRDNPGGDPITGVRWKGQKTQGVSYVTGEQNDLLGEAVAQVTFPPI